MKYTKELLESLLREGGATLLEEYSRYNQRLYVKFRCKCGVETTKRFEMLNVHKCPYCEECSKRVSAERGKQTCLTKYGVSNASKTKEVINKIQDVFQDKYGNHPKRMKETQEKWKATCLEKYGGHPNQNPEVQAKAEHTSFQHRDYTMPSGKVVKIQGYEDKALGELLEHFVEEEICVGRGRVPRIHYECAEGNNRVYFPDFYVKPTNTILEVKSEWTLKLQTCRLQEKAKAVLASGYRFEVWVYDGHKANKQVLAF